MPDRREQIADAAIEIIARDGLRALTHRAVDRELNLPDGSTSYYFRTRRSLIEATTLSIAARSRREFETQAGTETLGSLESLAGSIGSYLDHLLLRRRSDLAARYALTVDLSGDTELHALLAASLFSRQRAADLFRALGVRDPDTAGADFVSIVEGVVFDRFIGARSLDGIEPGTPRSVRQLAGVIEAYLRGATGA